jgi:hypothetical protein
MGNKGYSSAFWQTIFFEAKVMEISWAKRLRYSCPISSKTN